MGDFKSKLPDLNELAKFSGKLFRDVKRSVCEIIDEYKQKRAEENQVSPEENTSTPEAPPVPPVTATPLSNEHPEDKPITDSTKDRKEDGSI